MSEAISNNTEHDWEEQARDWVAWTRRPDHDSYWRYRDDFFGLVPEPGKATLDLGCGGHRLQEAIREPVARRAGGTVLDIPYHLWLRVLSPAW